MKLGLCALPLGLLAAGCAPSAPAEDERFVALANAYVEELLQTYPEFATGLGDHRWDGRLNDYTAAGIARSAALHERYLNDLEAIDSERLSPGNAIDYAILANRLRYSIWSAEELREPRWNPMVYNVGDAIYALLARDYAPLEERLESVRQRLLGIPAVFEAARANLANPPRVHTETAIRQNDGAAALIRDSLDEFVAAAPAMEARLAPAREAALEALEAHSQWLREELLPRAQGDFRIGEEKYRRKLAFLLHSDLSMEEILARARRRLAEIQEELYETAVPLYRDASPNADPDDLADRKAVVRAVLNQLADEHPTDGKIVADAEKALAEVAAFTRAKQLVTVPEEPLRIIVMPEFRRGVSTAYCDSPGPLEKDGETFYAISPTPEDWTAQRKLSFYREYNDYMLQDLTVHEAIPGHYLQLAHSNRLEGPTRIRSIFGSGTFVEGWAVYAEQMMAEHGYGGARFRMQQLKMLARAVINAILDQSIHAGAMTEEEAMAMMTQEGFQEDGEAAGKWKRAQLTSAQLSTYFVGIAEHNDMRSAWERRHGPITDWRAYHDQVLAHGSPPVQFVRGLLGL